MDSRTHKPEPLIANTTFASPMPREFRATSADYDNPSWPFVGTPTIFGPTNERMTHREITARLREANNYMSALCPERVWRHYSGSLYRVIGFTHNAETGEVMIQFQPTGHTYNVTEGEPPVFVHRLLDWLLFITLTDDGIPADHPNLKEGSTCVLHRYVPTFKVERYETAGQCAARDGRSQA